MAQPELTIIVVAFNMRREVMRTLTSLALPYQKDIAKDQYEVIVVENGSSEPLSRMEVENHGSNFFYHYLESPPPSPAFAINYGLAQAKGKFVSIMVDGAHMATPGLISYTISACFSVNKPVVLSQRFHLGPGPQPETVSKGYNQTVEDKMLASIEWPSNGYRLFEIGYPLMVLRKKQRYFWFSRMFESNYLVMRRDMMLNIGGCDEKFDIPGGGFLIPDLYKRAAAEDGVKLIYLIGEATFHQFHGGVSTSVTPERQREQLTVYKKQYQEIRGEEFILPKNHLSFYGHIPHQGALDLLNPVED